MRPALLAACCPVLVLSLVLPAATAWAEEPDEPGMLSLQAATPREPAAWRHAVKLDGGFMSATGFGGLNYIYAPVEVVNLEFGLGYGFSGVQVSVMPKVVIGTRSDRYVLGAGLALAVPTGSASIIEEPGLWLNVDLLGYEHRFDNGIGLSIALGGSVGLAGGNYQFSSDSSKESILGVILPQGRVSLSYWF